MRFGQPPNDHLAALKDFLLQASLSQPEHAQAQRYDQRNKDEDYEVDLVGEALISKPLQRH